MTMTKERTAANSSDTSSTDRIEDEVLLRAPRSRVWRALTTPDEFGAWFNVKLTTTRIEKGTAMQGQMLFPGYEHVKFDAIVEALEPEVRFAWRWHPNATEKGVDYSSEERTLVTFTLHDAPEGTLLRVVETGFDKLPAARRMNAFTGNTNGWKAQLHKRLAGYIEGA